ncbi:hypothetical protein [Methylorubrum extorquens]|uniref:Uncharacterized protein n=1 Tax=Methylorubrum extorquens (strain CM4 / NCIMB 13688) TaxID=440085 RepID=B7L1V5_METC4|nr:hypothetical protein [Methylorubrum extorquens]ACK81499.1 hypothetical protein Mchl_0577 [Methylorubrum extorquens CM4]
MTGLRERPFEWWAAWAEAEAEGPVAAGRATVNKVTARRLAVLAQVVPPLLERLEEPETAIQRVRANMVEMMQERLRERRQVLGDFAFYSTMQEEIATRIVALDAMLAERTATAP